jgi:hypothetical protein
MNINRSDTPFEEPDFTRDGIVLFGKFKDSHISALPWEFYKYLVAHYRFNLAVLLNHRHNTD